MNKKTITKILVLSVLLILFSLNIKASIFATIGVKGLSFASPQAAGVVQNVMKAYQITTDPSGFITGEMTGKITGEVMGEIAKQSPEAAKAIQQYQQVKGWVDEGAKITEDLKLDDKGQLVGGSATINKKQNVESITDKKISEVENMQLSSGGEGKPYQLRVSGDMGSATIGGNTYSNLQKGSTINVNRETGKVDEMDVTFTAATIIKVNEDEIKVPKGARVVYKDGKYDVYGKDQEVEINKQKIRINGENSINYDGKKITGKDFTYDEKRFTGIEDKSAEMTPVKEGYLLGKDTKMEDDRMSVTSEKGNVLYAKMCGDVSGFNNYVNPCAKKLTVEGDGFSVSLKEGKQFGLNIEKEDVFEYQVKGGKVVLDNGQQTMDLPEGKSVIVTDGNSRTRYVKLKGVDEELISVNYPYSIEEWDTSISSVYDGNMMGNTINEETGVEIVYIKDCEGSPTGGVIASSILGRVIGYVTFGEYCNVVGINTKDPFVKKTWDGNPILGASEKKEYLGLQGRAYYKYVELQEADGAHLYYVSSNGDIYEYSTSEEKFGDQPAYKESCVKLKSVFNMDCTTASAPSPNTLTPEKVTTTSTGKAANVDNLGKQVTGGGAIIEGISYKTMGNRLVEQGTNEFVGYISTRKNGIIETSEGRRFKELPGGAIKEI